MSKKFRHSWVQNTDKKHSEFYKICTNCGIWKIDVTDYNLAGESIHTSNYYRLTKDKLALLNFNPGCVLKPKQKKVKNKNQLTLL